MFVRTTCNREGRVYLKIVESYRENGQVKQRMIASLGRLDILEATGELDKLVAALCRFTTKKKIIDLASDISIDRVYYLGVPHLTHRLLEKAGLSAALEAIAQKHLKAKMPIVTILYSLICSRLLAPCSKRRLGLYWKERIYPELLPLEEMPLHWIYRTMDVIYSHRKDLEEAMFMRNGERDLFNQTMDIIFFDTTTLRFESTVAEEGALRQFGYSKERRTDCTQIVLGLLVDRDGIPVGYEIFPGNTYDGRSVPAMVKKLKNRYSLGRLIFVVDRGMLSQENLKALESHNQEFIIGMRLWAMPSKDQESLCDISKYQWITKTLAIREIPYKGKRLILTWSQQRAERDEQARLDIIKKIEQKLAKPNVRPKHFVTHTAYRQFLKGLEDGQPQLDQEAIALAQGRDGFFGVLTNVAQKDLGGAEIYERYKELWKIEDAFGEIKGPLKTRPMFHWTDRRIHAHVLICLLAYYLEAIIIRQFSRENMSFSAGEFLRHLNEVYAIPVQAGSQVAWARNELPGIVAQGYQLLRIRPPDRILKVETRKSVVTPNFSK